MSVLTNDTYRNKSGEVVTDTQWHTIVAWGDIADQVEQLLKKGSNIDLEGRLVYRDYIDAKGVKRYVTEVVMNSFQLLSPPTETAEGPDQQ